MGGWPAPLRHAGVETRGEALAIHAVERDKRPVERQTAFDAEGLGRHTGNTEQLGDVSRVRPGQPEVDVGMLCFDEAVHVPAREHLDLAEVACRAYIVTAVPFLDPYLEIEGTCRERRQSEPLDNSFDFGTTDIRYRRNAIELHDVGGRADDGQAQLPQPQLQVCRDVPAVDEIRPRTELAFGGKWQLVDGTFEIEVKNLVGAWRNREVLENDPDRSGPVRIVPGQVERLDFDPAHRETIGSLTRALGDREAGEAGNQEVLAQAKRVGLPDMITANSDDVARRIDEGFLGLLMSGPQASEAIEVGRAHAGR